MSGKTDFEKLIPLTPAVFHILLALANEDRHGYGIMQEINFQTGGKLRMGPGTLYGNLKKLLEEGWIEEIENVSSQAPENERRRYYRLTVSGRGLVQAEAERLAHLVKVAEAKQLLKRPGLEEGRL